MRIPTGNPDLDTWLSGGYEKDIITTFYGPAGSGKTNLCLLAAVEQASLGKKVIFIDTEGGFSIDRVKQIADEDILRNIIVLRPTSFLEQKDVFRRLLKLVKKDIGLIIVDSLVMLYRLDLGEALTSDDRKRAQIINRILARQLRILSEIARKKQIPVLVTDQVYGEFLTKEEFKSGKEKGVVMVGGSIINYWSKCIIELQNQKTSKKAILRKHRSLPEQEFSFKIVEKGIKKN
ncbi:MAG: DNA repair and recombination protein RadB [archaeon]|nr:MAG: DNA repair and recombination protein RadB [archaeon]